MQAQIAEQLGLTATPPAERPARGKQAAASVIESITISQPPTNTALFLLGWYVTAIGCVLSWAGMALTFVGAQIVNAGRAMRLHAEHKEP